MDQTADTDQRDSTPTSGTSRTRRNQNTKRNKPETRNTRTRTEPTLDNDEHPTEEEQSTDDQDDTTEGPIKNTIFPIYKLLRKHNLKIITAQHHKEYLTNLQQLERVPKGLKPKITTTTTELPPSLFIRWEKAHIALACTLRDILLDYWNELETKLRSEIDKISEELSESCTTEEFNLINTIIGKASLKKREELKTRRSKKTKPRGGTAGSAATNQ